MNWLDIVIVAAVWAIVTVVLNAPIKRRPSKKREPKARADISCPDCGLDPHTPNCRFAWMGPPPTEFKFLTMKDLS